MSIRGPKHANEILVEDVNGNVVPVIADENGNLKVSVAGDIKIDNVDVDAVTVKSIEGVILAEPIKAGLSFYGDVNVENRLYRFQKTLTAKTHISNISLVNNLGANRMRLSASFIRGGNDIAPMPGLFGQDILVAPGLTYEVPVNFCGNVGDIIVIDVVVDAIGEEELPEIDGAILITGYNEGV